MPCLCVKLKQKDNLQVFTGHQHTFEKNLLKCDWSADGKKVCLSISSATVAVQRLLWPTCMSLNMAAAMDNMHIPSRLGCVQVTAGSGDKMVYVWDVASRHLLYKLPGHTGSVNETAFHPNEPIIGSAASDKNIYLGELTE